MKTKKHETRSQQPAVEIQAVSDGELVTVTGGWSASWGGSWNASSKAWAGGGGSAGGAGATSWWS